MCRGNRFSYSVYACVYECVVCVCHKLRNVPWICWLDVRGDIMWWHSFIRGPHVWGAHIWMSHVTWVLCELYLLGINIFSRALINIFSAHWSISWVLYFSGLLNTRGPRMNESYHMIIRAHVWISHVTWVTEDIDTEQIELPAKLLDDFL